MPGVCAADARTTWRSGEVCFTVEGFSCGATCAQGGLAGHPAR
jgi:hypothetical protein